MIITYDLPAGLFRITSNALYVSFLALFPCSTHDVIRGVEVTPIWPDFFMNHLVVDIWHAVRYQSDTSDNHWPLATSS